MDDIFGGSDSDDDLALDDDDEPSKPKVRNHFLRLCACLCFAVLPPSLTAHCPTPKNTWQEAAKPAAAAAAKPAADDDSSDDDLDLELESSDDDDDGKTDKMLADLLARQKGKKRKAPAKKPAQKKKPAEKKPRKPRKPAAKKEKIPKKPRKQSADGEGASGGGSGDEQETAEDRAFVEHTGDTDDEGDVIKTKGGWGEDDDIEDNGDGEEDELNQTDKKWLDQMWGRNQKKKKEKSLDEYKVIALKFKQRMDDAADDDEAAHKEGKPCLEKLAMLEQVRTEMRKHELQVLFLEECGILRTFKRWLDPINGKTFPNHNLKLGVLEILNEMTDPEQGGNAVNPDQVRESGIGGIVMLYRTKDKNPHIKNVAMKIVDRWSRPVLGTGSHSHRKLHKEVEKEQGDGSVRRFTKLQARRDSGGYSNDATTQRNRDAAKLEQFLEDRKKKAKIGDAGFEFHSGWPMPGEKNYRKNVMQDATLAAFEKELERKDMTLEEYMKQKSEMREMDRCANTHPLPVNLSLRGRVALIAAGWR